MAERLENQMNLIEVILQDKMRFQTKIEELLIQAEKDKEKHEKLKKNLTEQFEHEFKRKKDIFIAQEKIK